MRIRSFSWAFLAATMVFATGHAADRVAMQCDAPYPPLPPGVIPEEADFMIDARGAVSMNGERLDLKKLHSYAQSTAKNQKNGMRVELEAHSDVPAGKVANLIKILRADGIRYLTCTVSKF